MTYSESENWHNHQDNPEMDDELPILKGILNGEVKYHNARRYLLSVFSSLLQVLTYVLCMTHVTSRFKCIFARSHVQYILVDLVQ